MRDARRENGGVAHRTVKDGMPMPDATPEVHIQKTGTRDWLAAKAKATQRRVRMAGGMLWYGWASTLATL